MKEAGEQGNCNGCKFLCIPEGIDKEKVRSGIFVLETTKCAANTARIPNIFYILLTRRDDPCRGFFEPVYGRQTVVSNAPCSKPTTEGKWYFEPYVPPKKKPKKFKRPKSLGPDSI